MATAARTARAMLTVARPDLPRHCAGNPIRRGSAMWGTSRGCLCAYEQCSSDDPSSSGKRRRAEALKSLERANHSSTPPEERVARSDIGFRRPILLCRMTKALFTDWHGSALRSESLIAASVSSESFQGAHGAAVRHAAAILGALTSSRCRNLHTDAATRQLQSRWNPPRAAAVCWRSPRASPGRRPLPH